MNLKTDFKTKIQKMKTKKTLDTPKTPPLDYPRASRINDGVKEDKSPTLKKIVQIINCFRLKNENREQD